MYQDKCPKCGNDNLKIYEQIAIGRIVSARTGKVLENKGIMEVTCWNYLCKCGWAGEIHAQ
ncbi:hypothetical protein PC41400_21665 [Paenibacillus chitinolyticus]|uniref:Uncharacterized protein n=1 Tax=Paenibacillus chitinolyticus TaxID=79263 RepID=A0A410X0J7_9BACL|nr:hypothetical protein PC41400_21665 [Paenibacillus chitinolyticus]